MRKIIFGLILLFMTVSVQADINQKYCDTLINAVDAVYTMKEGGVTKDQAIGRVIELIDNEFFRNFTLQSIELAYKYNISKQEQYSMVYRSCGGGDLV